MIAAVCPNFVQIGEPMYAGARTKHIDVKVSDGAEYRAQDQPNIYCVVSGELHEYE